MAGQNQQQQKQDPQAADNMTALLAAGLSTNQGTTATLAELLAFQLEERREAKRIKDLQAEQEKRVRLEGAQAHAKERKLAEAKQRVCDHRYEHTGRPHTGGVRSLNGQVSISCGKCSKVWEGTEQELRTGELGIKGLYPEPTRFTGPIQQ